MTHKYELKRVNHGKGEYARDEDKDSKCEIHVNTIEGSVQGTVSGEMGVQLSLLGIGGSIKPPVTRGSPVGGV